MASTEQEKDRAGDDDEDASKGRDDEQGEEESYSVVETLTQGQREQAGLEDDTDKANLGYPLSTSSATSSDSESDDSSDETSSDDSISNLRKKHISCIQEAQLSPDGSCIFTSDYSRTFSVYPIDTDIFSETGTRKLAPYAASSSSNPIWAFAASPLFNVQDANSTQVLMSRRDSYITLHNALWDTTAPSHGSQNATLPKSKPVNIARPLASYKLIDHLTEAVTAPLSLAYSHDGLYFFAGKQNSIATFDIEHTSDPIHTIATIPAKRNTLKGGGRGFKGTVSALSLSPATSSSPNGLLAAGARTRHVGIYNPISGESVTHFSLPGTIAGKKIRNDNLAHTMGDGVSSLTWSPCGMYLYVAERNSNVLLIYDVRNFALALGYCTGRKALTKQKLGFNVWDAGVASYDHDVRSHEVWAGGTDGCLRVWRDPYLKEGAVVADEVVKVGEGNMPVASTLVHRSGSLAVAASGIVDVGNERFDGIMRGGGLRPHFREWGALDIFGLG